jgi:hypothetical protein
LNKTASDKFDKFAEEAGQRLGQFGRKTKAGLSAAASATGKAANTVGDSIADSVSGAAHALTFSFNTLAQKTQSKGPETVPMKSSTEQGQPKIAPTVVPSHPPDAAASESPTPTILWVAKNNHSLGVILTKSDGSKLQLNIGDFISFNRYDNGALIREFTNPAGEEYYPDRPVYMEFTPWLKNKNNWDQTELFSKCVKSETQPGPNEVRIDWNTVKQLSNKPAQVPPDHEYKDVKASQVDVDPLLGEPLTQSNPSSPSSTGPTGLKKYKVILIDKTTPRFTRSQQATIQLTKPGDNIAITFEGDRSPQLLSIKSLKFDLDDDKSKGCMSKANFQSNDTREICITVTSGADLNVDFVKIPFTMRFENDTKCDDFKKAVEKIRSRQGESSMVEAPPAQGKSLTVKAPPAQGKSLTVKAPLAQDSISHTGSDEGEDDPLGAISLEKSPSRAKEVLKDQQSEPGEYGRVYGVDFENLGIGFSRHFGTGGSKRKRCSIKKNRRSIRRTTIRRRQYKNNNKKNRSFKK